MKVLIPIDQTASLIAGIDAPNSTLVVDISPADLSAETRALIMPGYDLVTGAFKAPSPGGFYHRGGFGPDPVLANAGPAEVLAALEAFAGKIVADNAEYEAKLEAHNKAREAEALRVKEQQDAEAARLAAARVALVGGTAEIINTTPTGCYVTHDGKTAFLPSGDDIAPAIEAFEKARAEAAAAAEAERKAQHKALCASRLESGEWSKEFSSYNERRYGAWWGAKVTFDGAKAVYDFNAATSDATHGNAGTVTIPCRPGEVIAYGQKDLRKGRGENNLLMMRKDGSMMGGTAAELRKAQLEFLKQAELAVK